MRSILLPCVVRVRPAAAPSASTRGIHHTGARWSAAGKAATYEKMMANPQLAQRAAEYAQAPTKELIRRVVALELAMEGMQDDIKARLEIQLNLRRELQGIPKPLPSNQGRRTYDVLGQPCRKIALRIAYDGEPYLGLAAQASQDTLLPTPFSVADGQDLTPEQMGPGTNSVEAVLWRALSHLRLVAPQYGMEAADFTRCGRTDRGVSSASQVISMWVRSKTVDEWEARKAYRRSTLHPERQGKWDPILDRQPAHDKHGQIKPVQFDTEEFPYVQALNGILPRTIRVTGWSPVRPEFSARFDCRYRHYKYFFTDGAPPALCGVAAGRVTPGRYHAGPKLDVRAMREAATRFLGEHDFVNLCRVRPDQQVTNFRRRVDGISIDRVDAGWPLRTPPNHDPALGHGRKDLVAYDDDQESPIPGEEERMYVMNLRGTAFLYHQVRHMIAVLFLVGTGLEHPSIVDELLNVERGAVAADRLANRIAGLRIGADAAPNHVNRVALPQSTATTMQGNVVADQPFETFGDRQRAAREELEALRQAVHRGQANKDKNGTDAHLHDGLDQLYDTISVIEGRPMYQMARGEPLMLWECGFRASDVQWRTGTYDGPIVRTTDPVDPDLGAEANWPAVVQQARQWQGQQSGRDTASVNLVRGVHAEWVRKAIKAEMYRHLVLACPTPSSGGWGPASTLFHHARFPTLVPPPSELDILPEPHTHVPIGNGGSAPGAPNYRNVARLLREESAQVRNDRYRTEKSWKLDKRKRVVREKYSSRPGPEEAQEKLQETE